MNAFFLKKSIIKTNNSHISELIQGNRILRSEVFLGQNILRSEVFLGKNILRSEVFCFVIEIKSVSLQRFIIGFHVREDF
jgi:hypothetical protein